MSSQASRSTPTRSSRPLSATDSVPSILQMIADAFVALCPSKAVAIFVLSGPQFHIEAEAGLPQRPRRKLGRGRLLALGLRAQTWLARLPTAPHWGKSWTPGLRSASPRRWSPVPEKREARSRYSTVSQGFWTTQLGKQSRAYAILPAWRLNMVSSMSRSCMDRKFDSADRVTQSALAGGPVAAGDGHRPAAGQPAWQFVASAWITSNRSTTAWDMILEMPFSSWSASG